MHLFRLSHALLAAVALVIASCPTWARAGAPPCQTAPEEPSSSIDASVRACWESYEALARSGEVHGKTVAIFPAIFVSLDGRTSVGQNGDQIARRLRELAPKGVVCITDDGLRRRLDANLLGTSSYTSVDDLGALALQLQVGYAIAGEIRSRKNKDVVGEYDFELRLVGARPGGASFDHDQSRTPPCPKEDGRTGNRIREFHNGSRIASRVGWGSDPRASQPRRDTVAQADYLATVVSQLVTDFVDAHRSELAGQPGDRPLGIAPSLRLTADGEMNTAFSNLIESEFARVKLGQGGVLEPRKLVNAAQEANTQLRFYVDDDPPPSVLSALGVRGIVFVDYDYQEWLQRLTLKLRYVGARVTWVETYDISTARSSEAIAKALQDAGLVPRDAAVVDGESMLTGALSRVALQLINEQREKIGDANVRVAPVLTDATAVWEAVLDMYRNALLLEKQRVLDAGLKQWQGKREPAEALAEPAFPVKLLGERTYSCWNEAQMAVLLEATCAFETTKEQASARRWKEHVEKTLGKALEGVRFSASDADKNQRARLMGDVHAAEGAKPVSWRDSKAGYLVQLRVLLNGNSSVEVHASLVDWNQPLVVVATRSERLPRAVNQALRTSLEKSSFPEEALLMRFLGREFTKEQLKADPKK